MAEPMERGSSVPLEEVMLAQAFEFEALLIVLGIRYIHPFTFTTNAMRRTRTRHRIGYLERSAYI
jgi:hypothetical protein